MHTDLINALRSTFARFTIGDESSETSIHFRYLGSWVMPEDENDDGDYDWKVPTKATADRIAKIADEFGYTWTYEEKEWIVFTMIDDEPDALVITPAGETMRESEYDDKREAALAAKRARQKARRAAAKTK